MICLAEDCDLPSNGGKGMCKVHYMRWKRNGHTDLLVKEVVICSVDGCEAKAKARGWCHKHYARWWRHGGTDFRGKDGSSNTYAAVHSRMRNADHPSNHQCLRCPSVAQEWAYTGGDPDELLGKNGKGELPYSLNTEYYIPLCISCHRKMDKTPTKNASELVH